MKPYVTALLGLLTLLGLLVAGAYLLGLLAGIAYDLFTAGWEVTQ